MDEREPRGSEGRAAHIKTMRRPSGFNDVVASIALFTAAPGSVYVEQLSDGWRWSPAHRGGAYPLLRIVARFLGVDYARIVLPFNTTEDGWAVLQPDDDVVGPAAATAVLSFTETATVGTVRQRLVEEFGL